MTPKETNQTRRYNANGDAQNENMNRRKDYSALSRIIWKNVMVMGYLHVVGLYALLTIAQYHWQTVLFNFCLSYLGSLGVTAGVHRLWSHRSYKAKLPLRIFLMLANTIACQNSICDWTRDHRTHHKYTETDADPYSAKRGFFFSHVGWLLVHKHPDVVRKGKTIPLDDLYRDPVVAFQKKYYLPLAMVICFVIPTLIPWLCWKEGFWNSFSVTILRYCVSLNVTWMVNSLAHMYGNRPYDITTGAANNKLVALFAIGEGFHNYHHTFPQDYATSEYGMKLNLTTFFINFMALIGQAYDRRSVSKEVIEARQKRTGMYSNILAEATENLKSS